MALFMKEEDGISKEHTRKVCLFVHCVTCDLSYIWLSGFNAGSIAIAYIGTFITKVPNKNQLRAGFLLMDEGVKLGKLTKDYKIYGHGQLIPTQSPGDAFYELIKTWPHWTNATMVTK